MNKPMVDSPHFHNEQAAYDFVESILWRSGPKCPALWG